MRIIKTIYMVLLLAFLQGCGSSGMVDNAISAPAEINATGGAAAWAASTSGAVMYNAPVDNAVQRVTITTDGSPMLLIGQYSAAVIADGTIRANLTRSGGLGYISQAAVDVLNNKYVSITVIGIDAPPAGSYTYSLNMGSDHNGVAQYRTLAVVRIK